MNLLSDSRLAQVINLRINKNVFFKYQKCLIGRQFFRSKIRDKDICLILFIWIGDNISA